MVFITFIGAFFPILLATIHGVERLDRRLIDASLSLGARPWQVFAEVVVPGALPSIVTGLSIGMGTSWFSDPVEDLTVILMTQAGWTSPTPPAICRDFWTSAYQAIDD